MPFYIARKKSALARLIRICEQVKWRTIRCCVSSAWLIDYSKHLSQSCCWRMEMQPRLLRRNRKTYVHCYRVRSFISHSVSNRNPSGTSLCIISLMQSFTRVRFSWLVVATRVLITLNSWTESSVGWSFTQKFNHSTMGSPLRGCWVRKKTRRMHRLFCFGGSSWFGGGRGSGKFSILYFFSAERLFRV